MHRAENVDYRERFAPVLEQIAAMATTLNYDVVFPIHPRTKSKIQEFGLDYLIASLGDYRIHAIDPAGPLDMLQLIANAQTVLTDSGGIQEEACILQVPCITLRTTTERPESLAVGANILVGDALRKLSSYPDLLCQYVAQSVSKKRDWTNPFGDGTAAQQIVDICYRQCM
jgi:UDP-N-acetylglucosamine 2-epimerase (non-hydrolysing)